MFSLSLHGFRVTMISSRRQTLERTHPPASLGWYPPSPPNVACTFSCPSSRPRHLPRHRHHRRALQHLPRQRHHHQGLRHRPRHLVDLGIATSLLPFNTFADQSVGAVGTWRGVDPARHCHSLSAILACLLLSSRTPLYCNRSVSCMVQTDRCPSQHYMKHLLTRLPAAVAAIESTTCSK